MVNEIAGLGEWIDSWQVREDINKVSEQAVKKAQTDAKKAKQVQQEIKQSKKENSKIASFLTFLLKDLRNEKLVTSLYNSFFKVYHEKREVTYLRKNVNSIVIVGFFAPFYWDKIQEFELLPYFDQIYDVNQPLNIHNYLDYIKKLSHKHHDNIPINITSLIELLVEIIKEYELNKHHMLENKDTEELKIFFRKELGVEK